MPATIGSIRCPDCGTSVQIAFMMPTTGYKLVALALCPNCVKSGDTRTLRGRVNVDEDSFIEVLAGTKCMLKVDNP